MGVFPTNLPDRTGSPLGFMTGGNLARGLLSAGLSAGGATAQVNFDPVAAGYPTTGYLIISRGGSPREVVKYGGRSASGGNPGSFTSLTRGQAGSTDQAHVSGDEIVMGLFYGVIDDIISEVIAGLTKMGTGSSTPATAGYLLRSSGSGASAWASVLTPDIKAPYVRVGFGSSTTQSFTTGGSTIKVAWDAEVTDTYNMAFGAAANSVKLSHSGIWLFFVSIIFNASGVTGPCSFAFYNETAAQWFGGYDYYYSSRTNPSVTGVGVLSCNANDEITVHVVNNVPATTLTTYSGGSGAGPVWIAVHLGPA